MKEGPLRGLLFYFVSCSVLEAIAIASASTPSASLITLLSVCLTIRISDACSLLSARLTSSFGKSMRIAILFSPM